jgi:hypothetical protein
MKKILVCWLLAAACGGGSNKAQPAQPAVSNQVAAETAPVAPRTESELALDKMQQFTDTMCACSDKDCVQKVADDMTSWSMEMAKKSEEPPKMSEADTKRASDIGKRMGDCMQRAMLGPNATPSGGSGATP